MRGDFLCRKNKTKCSSIHAMFSAISATAGCVAEVQGRSASRPTGANAKCGSNSVGGVSCLLSSPYVLLACWESMNHKGGGERGRESAFTQNLLHSFNSKLAFKRRIIYSHSTTFRVNRVVMAAVDQLSGFFNQNNPRRSSERPGNLIKRGKNFDQL